jgi:hypothetical protein
MWLVQGITNQRAERGHMPNYLNDHDTETGALADAERLRAEKPWYTVTVTEHDEAVATDGA